MKHFKGEREMKVRPGTQRGNFLFPAGEERRKWVKDIIPELDASPEHGNTEWTAGSDEPVVG